MNKDIRLLVLDLDGTVLDPHQDAPIRPRVLQAVARVQQLGYQVSLASGRTWESARRRLEELQLSLPMVASQGASLVTAQGEILFEERLAEPVARELLHRLPSLETTVACYFRHRHSGALVIRQNRARAPWSSYHHLFGPQTQVDTDLVGYLEHFDLLKFIAVDSSPLAVPHWSQWAGPQVQLSRSHHLLVEGTAPATDKGTGLRRLLHHLGLAPPQLMVIGDNYNDLPMFALAGLSVAMGQAPAEVQAAAHWVAPPFEADGVAVALEKFLIP